MQNYKYHIEKLKQLTGKNDADFEELTLYFFDHVAENPEARQRDKPLKSKENHDYYTSLLLPITGKYQTEVKNLYLLEIKKTTLVHGSVILKDESSLLIYFFTDIKTGIAYYPNPITNMADYYRITAFHLQTTPTGTFHSSKSDAKIVH